MIEAEASLVAAVEPVDHVLDALDVAPVGESGAVGGAAGGERGGGGWGLLRLHAACRTARQPGGGGRVESKKYSAQISKSGVGGGSWAVANWKVKQQYFLSSLLLDSSDLTTHPE